MSTNLSFLFFFLNSQFKHLLTKMSLLTLNPKIQNFKTLQNPSIQITPNYTQTAFSLFTSYSSQLQNSIPNLGISPLFDSQTPTFLVMPQPKSRAKKEKKKRKKKKEGSQMLFFEEPHVWTTYPTSLKHTISPISPHISPSWPVTSLPHLLLSFFQQHIHSSFSLSH